MVTSPESTSSAPTSAPSVAPLTSWRPSVTAAGTLPDRLTTAHHQQELPPAAQLTLTLPPLLRASSHGRVINQVRSRSSPASRSRVLAAARQMPDEALPTDTGFPRNPAAEVSRGNGAPRHTRWLSVRVGPLRPPAWQPPDGCLTL